MLPKKFNELQSAAGAWNLMLSFGLTLLVGLWITIKVGSWLDAHLGTGVVFQVLGIIVAIISAFRLLLESADDLERKEKKRREEAKETNDKEA